MGHGCLQSPARLASKKRGNEKVISGSAQAVGTSSTYGVVGGIGEAMASACTAIRTLHALRAYSVAQPDGLLAAH